MVYNLSYYDGELEKRRVIVQDGIYMRDVDKYIITPILQEAYIYITTDDNKFDSIRAISEKMKESTKAKSSGEATVITWGTAAISILLATPVLSTLPFAGPLGLACTVTGLATGVVDADRIDKETMINNKLYLDANDENINVIRMGECMSLYTAITLRTTPILKKDESTWQDYKRELNNRKSDSKSKGEFTPDEKNIIVNNMYLTVIIQMK